ncbi:MAG: polyphosphate kinase 2 family protein [Spirochaetales bacterium]|nr:polyphosphate kinase 2 family protein [Spirochaetales bacterium]
MDIDIKDYRVKDDDKINLKKIPAEYKGKLSKDECREEFEKQKEKLQELQEVLYADEGKALLVVFQAMDAGGKDSTIRHVIGPLNPAGCRVTSFKAPTVHELAHDFLWRIHANIPPRGYIGVFNRSHYEDILIVKVKKLAPEEVIEKRYDHINHFEKLLSDEGTRIVKFYLHISKLYQKKRLERRLERPDKYWKFNADDLKERELWDDYMDAFETALSHCSKKHAPWYIIPSETRWFRDVLVAEVLIETLKDMDLHYPKPDYDPNSIIID